MLLLTIERLSLSSSAHITVIGGGLAGCEAALTLAEAGATVRLFEMRPGVRSPAHHTDLLAELVCSNSLKNRSPETAAGLLKAELRLLGSHLLRIAEACAVPAGGALAVDRALFSGTVTRAIEQNPLIEVVHEEILSVPQTGQVIIASGPLTSDGLAASLSQLLGRDHLAFFDAAAPIVSTESIDREAVFAASRYEKGVGADYLNAPMNKEEYLAFIAELLCAQRVIAKDFEKKDLFSACQPIEEVARTGVDSLRFGPLKPVGLTDPRTGERPWAVVQFRAENTAGTAYNLVGFQTNLTWPEQRRVFGMIPGLAEADFLRFGVMHRNTFVDAPSTLDATLAIRQHPRLRIAGQLSGTEGYTEAIASGHLAALNTIADRDGGTPVILPADTALGSLIRYATDPETIKYQPMHVNFGLVPPLEKRVRGKRERYSEYSRRALSSLSAYIDSHPSLTL